MYNILIFVESRFPVDRQKIKKTTTEFLTAEKLRGNVELGIAIVGDRKMKSLNSSFRDKNESTTVLAFPLENTGMSNPLQKNKSVGFVYPPDGLLRLGDVIISYPQAVERAAEDDMLVDDMLDKLLVHGLRNLIGKGSEPEE